MGTAREAQPVKLIASLLGGDPALLADAKVALVRAFGSADLESEFLPFDHTDYYAPEYERCIKWDDSSLGIDWQYEGEPLISAKDAEGLEFDKADIFE